jgi:hypothetical protein
MSATLDEIMLGLKAALGDIDGLTAYSVEPGSPKLPAAWPFVRTTDYRVTFDGSMIWNIAVSVAVSAAEVGRAQTNIYPYLDQAGPKSIRQAIESDPSLGLTGVSCAVKGVLSMGRAAIAGVEPIVAQLDLEVLVS